VVCCGLATLDLAYVVARPPLVDEKVVARELRVDAGGPALNAARTVVALGGRATLVTALGSGPLADLVRSRLGGVTVVDVAPGDHTPPVSTVMVDDSGGRAVVSTNATRLGSPAPVSLPSDADALLVDGHLMTTSTALAASAGGPPVILDGGSWKDGLERLLPRVSVAALSAAFRLPDGDDALTGVIRRGAAAAVRTHGPLPVEILSAGQLRRVAVPPADVVDSLGAGDVFHGALAFALARGAGLDDAVAGAVVLASESVRHPGAMGWASGA